MANRCSKSCRPLCFQSSRLAIHIEIPAGGKNMLGQEAYRKTLDNVSGGVLNINALTAGTYIVNIEGYGNMFSVSPMFSNAANGDYTLQEQSPAVDLGSNSVVPAGITTDLAGNALILGANVDKGAFENLQAVSITPDANGVVYVKPGSTGNNNGSSWANATQGLAKALFTAYNNPQITAIWVPVRYLQAKIQAGQFIPS